MSKTKQKDELFGTKEVTKLFIEYLLDQSSILMGVVKKGFSDIRLNKIKVVLASIVNNATAIGILSERDLSNESTMLSRSFMERVVNCCYLMVCSDDEFENYFSYSLQKSFRKLDRKVSIGSKEIGVKFSGKFDVDQCPELKTALQQFTGKKGGEKTRWTDKSIEDRLALIDKKLKIKSELFLYTHLTVYEDASEALHGTFYGATFHIGQHLPEFERKDKVSTTRREQKNISLLAVNCGSIINELIRAINQVEDVSGFFEKTETNTKNVAKLMSAVIKNT